MIETNVQAGLVQTETDGAICYVTLCAPDSLNAVDANMAVALRDVCGSVLSDDGITVVVFRGAGRGFCAGGDLRYISQFAGRTDEALDNILLPFHEFLEKLNASNKIIAFSVHGAVAGAGLSLVSMGDFCIAEEGTKFVPAYAAIGLTPDGGGTIGLTRSVGMRHALRYLLAEDKFGCTDALRTGLVTKIATKGTLEDTTKQFAERLASFPQVVLAGTKHLLRSAGYAEISQQLEHEHAQLGAAMKSELFQIRLREIARANGVI
tara:strand:- start:26045 stop:26836 length:792 start_codon:yes stop_codon:yes gene_type:complete